MKNKKRISAMLLSLAIGVSAIPFGVCSAYGAETVLSQGVWYESMYIEWSAPAGSSYDVYCKQTSEAESAYKKIDAELVREVTAGNYRADVLGLKGGVSYDLKVTAAGSDTAVATYTGTPEAYDRSGFAFDGTSNAPGAYKADGTPEDGALILYVTEANKKNVYKNKTIKSIIGGFNSLNGGKPVILRVVGKVTPLSTSDTNPGMWKNTCGVTIEGVGPGSGFSGWGIGSGDNSDTEFRNLNFVDYVEDAIGFEGAEKLWVHNNTFYSGYNPKDSTAERDKLHGDGSCDLRECDKVTVSYNHFDGTDKTSLIGSSSSSREKTGNITFHHNYFESTKQRTPRVRWHNIHVYNNYYRNTGAYGVGATCNSSIFAENNYFEDASSPFLTSSQGGFASKFSDNEGGVIKAFNNIMVNCRESLEGVDYFNAPSREYRMTGADFTAIKGGWTYNNFDATGYIGSKSYTLHTPEEAKTIALTKTGAMEKTAIEGTDNIAPDRVTGNVTAAYYYDPAESGKTGTAYGGIDGSGTFFKGSDAACTAGSASGYRDAEKYSYKGKYTNGGKITFTTTSAAKFTIVAGSSASAPVRMTLSGTGTVPYGVFQSGCKGGSVLSTIDIPEAGTYSFTAGSNIDIYYIEVSEYDGKEVITTETTTETTTTEPTTDPGGLFGDADLSGKLTSNDAAFVLRKALEPAFVTNHAGYELFYFDANRDNEITADDAAMILQKVQNDEIVLPF